MFCSYFFARFSSFCHKFCMNVFCPQKGASFGRAGGDGQKERRRLRTRGAQKKGGSFSQKGGKKAMRGKGEKGKRCLPFTQRADRKAAPADEGRVKERRHVPPKGGEDACRSRNGQKEMRRLRTKARKRKAARSAKRDRAARKEGAAFRVLFDFLKEIILLFPLFSLSSFWAFPQRRALRQRRRGLPLLPLRQRAP